MNRIVYLLLLSILSCLQLKAQDAVAPNPNAAEISFETDVHDYGTKNKVVMELMSSSSAILERNPLLFPTQKDPADAPFPPGPTSLSKKEKQESSK